jgi:hypothetical protein
MHILVKLLHECRGIYAYPASLYSAKESGLVRLLETIVALYQVDSSWPFNISGTAVPL